MRKVRIAQIGINTNSHGAPVFQSLKRNSEYFEIVGYALPENERERLAWQLPMLEGYPELTLEQILNDPTIEAVTVETDEVNLTKYALMAVRAGKHIHMEKPGGVSLEAFEELIAEVKARGNVFHTGYMYRYNPYVQEMLQRVKAGELGRMHGIRFVESNLAPVIKTGAQSYATYKTMLFAKDAFGVIDVEGGGMETIIKTKGEIGGPLEQFGTVGVKFEMAAKILYQERMVTVWSGSSYSATETQNITEAA